MTLNIGTTRTNTTRRGKLVDDVVDEITSWNPREFMAAFARLHHGQVSLVHLNVLTVLEALGPLPMSRLAEALDISVASVTGVVDRMEARGLVERRRDAGDRRVILVHPAEGGRRLFSEIDAKRRQGLSKLLGRLSEPELTSLLTGHRALRAARAAFTRDEIVRDFTATGDAPGHDAPGHDAPGHDAAGS